MIDLWNDLDVMQQIFYLIAIPSTIVLFLQTLLLLFGLGADHDVDGDIGLDTDGGDISSDYEFQSAADHAGGLRVFTVRGIVAFLAIFGWTGVAALDMGAEPPIAFVAAFIAGTLALLIVVVIIRSSMKLQQSGNLDLQNAIGQIGEVYLTIPKGGRGKITLIIQERYIEMDAICPNRTVKYGEQVKVTGITNNNTLIVTPL